MTTALLAVFARAVGFLARAPGFSRANVPAAVRVICAFMLALAVLPSAGKLHERAVPAFLVIVACEVLTGAVFGFGATLIFEGVAAAGRVLDDLVGLRGSVPGISVAPAGFGGLWMLVFVAAYFALGGIDRLVLAFAASFSLVPLGAAVDAQTLRGIGLSYAAHLLGLCLQLAAPAICITLCVHAGLAVLTRVVPRFGHLSLAYPAAYGCVLLVAFVSLASVRDLVWVR